jgi:hypothetical protein
VNLGLRCGLGGNSACGLGQNQIGDPMLPCGIDLSQNLGGRIELDLQSKSRRTELLSFFFVFGRKTVYHGIWVDLSILNLTRLSWNLRLCQPPWLGAVFRSASFICDDLETEAIKTNVAQFTIKKRIGFSKFPRLNQTHGPKANLEVSTSQPRPGARPAWCNLGRPQGFVEIQEGQSQTLLITEASIGG